jgi:hypothetical protein
MADVSLAHAVLQLILGGVLLGAAIFGFLLVASSMAGRK